MTSAPLANKHTSHFSDRTLRSDYLLAGRLWCTKHQCNYVGWANQDREYYACSLRNKNLIPASECPLVKKDAIEQFILKVVTEEILQPETVRRALVTIEEETRREKEAASGKVSSLGGEVKQAEGELARYQNTIANGITPEALADPMNRCYQKLAELKSRLRPSQP